MTDLKTFRKANALKQIELAQYLDVSREFLSLIETGKSKLPEDKLRKLLTNTEGWDVSMFAPDQRSINAGSHSVIVAGNGKVGDIDARHFYSDSPDVLRAQIELLDERIKEKDAQIKEKDAQIKQLLDILAKK